MRTNYITKTLTVIGMAALVTLPAAAGGLGDLLGGVAGIVGGRNPEAAKVIGALGVVTSLLEEGQCLTLADGSQVVDSERYQDEAIMVRTILDLFKPGWRGQSEDARNLAFMEMRNFLNVSPGSCIQMECGIRSLTAQRPGSTKIIVTIRSR
jgi:hypothetical protein